MKSEKLRASRRRFLTSIGATTAMLPFLRSLPGYAQGTPATKLILMFSGNGRIRHLWGADEVAGALTFRQNLSKLQPIAEHVVITEGIRNFCAPLIGGTHEGGMASLFTGTANQSAMTGGAVGFPSIDALFMQQATGTVRSDSLYQQVVAVLNTAQNASPQNRCIYDATGVPRDPLRSGWEVMEQYLAGAIQNMTGGPTPEEVAKEQANKALFTSLTQQMNELMPKLCSEDRYQLEGMAEAVAKAGESVTRVACSPPTLPAKPNVQPWEALWTPPSDTIDLSQSTHWYRERSRLAIDLLVAGLACGVTRSGVLQYDQAASNAKAVGQELDHHNTSHQVPMLYDFVERMPGMAPDYKEVCLSHEKDPSEQMKTNFAKAWSELSVWENYYAEEFTYLVTQLKDHGILDDTLIVWGSEIDSGNGHNHHNMPFVMAAGANIGVQRGKVVSFPFSYPDNNAMGCIAATGEPVSHNDFLRTVLQAVGAEVPSVGSAEYNAGVLTSLLA
jgi:hypothetical protein